MRDEGPGFELSAVPAERRGIRDAVVGRMAFAGDGRRSNQAPVREPRSCSVSARARKQVTGAGGPGEAGTAPAPRLRVVVVDDHHLFRAGVKAELTADCDVVGEAAAPAEAIATIERLARRGAARRAHPRRGRRRRPARAPGDRRPHPRSWRCRSPMPPRTSSDDPRRCARYVTKTIDAAELIAAIERVAAGDAVLQPAPGRVRAPGVLRARATPGESDASLEPLTPREREVLHHLARGLLV